MAGENATAPRWLTPTEMKAWRRYIIASRRLIEALDSDLDAHALSMPDYEILVQLSDAPERRMRMSELAANALLSRSRLSHRMKVMEKELAVVRSAKAMASAAELVKKAKQIGQINLLTAQLENEVSVDDMRSIAIDLKGKLKSGVVVLATINNSKPMLVAAVSPEAIKLGIKAGELIKIGSTVLGGGGGGRG